MHVDETPFSLRTIQGLRPPVPRTPEGEKWRSKIGHLLVKNGMSRTRDGVPASVTRATGP
ncbi:hypothetical protein [Paraburkholderia sp. BR10954]|uniref:hypothetical protein n=1 Tax=Paraburkholderia sp. BR10954 TaxID=3236995 RepID=UPI0034D23253